MSYIGNSPGVASQRVTTTLTATAGQTQFTTQSGYVLGYVDVYLNGAKLVNGSDFEAITGTYITLFAGAAAGDVIELISYVPRGLSDGYTKAEADAKFLDVGGDTASGNLAFATASLTGNLTLSGGTANGIGYLNGSKVLTTGSGLTFDGENLTFNGTLAPRFLANMSGAQSTRFAFQNSTANGNTRIFMYPNGTGSITAINGFNTTDLTNYSAFDLAVIGTSDVRLSSNANGTGTYLPITFYNGGSERARIDSSGNIAIGKTSASSRLHISGSSGVNGAAVTLDIGAQQHAWYLSDSFTSVFNIGSASASSAWAWTYSGGEVARLTTTGLGIGTNSPQSTLDVYKGTANSKVAYIASLSSYVADHGPTIVFRNGSSGEELAGLKGAFTQSSQGNYGHLSLLTRTSDAVGITEKMRITHTGSLVFANTNTYGIIRRNTVNGSNGIVIQANAADAVDDSNAGAKIQIGGGTIGDTYEGNIDLIAYGSIVDSNRNQIRFCNRSGTNVTQERMRIDHNGKVLVGLTSSNNVAAVTVSRYGVVDAPIFTWTNATSNSGHMHVLTGGGAGIVADGFLAFGTNAGGANTFPERMRIDSVGQLTFLNSSGFRNYGIKSSGFGYSQSSYGALVIGSPVGGNNTTVCIGVDPSGNPSGAFSGLGAEVMFRNGVTFLTPNSVNNGFNSYLTLLDANVGIGTSSPGERLTVNGSVRSTSNAINFSGQTGSQFDYYNGEMRLAVNNGTTVSTMYFNAGSGRLTAPVVSAGTTSTPSTSATKLVVGGGTWNRPTYSSSLSASGNYIFNLFAHCGNTTFAAGVIRVIGTENQVNQSFAEYDFVMSRYVHDGTGAVNYHVRLKQRNRTQLNNGYGNVFLYLSNYSGSWTTTDQSASDGTSTVSGSTSIFDIYARNEVGQACSVAISVEYMDI